MIIVAEAPALYDITMCIDSIGITIGMITNHDF